MENNKGLLAEYIKSSLNERKEKKQDSVEEVKLNLYNYDPHKKFTGNWILEKFDYKVTKITKVL